MMRYEQDFIYQIVPNLTKAIEGLTKELKRYNDRNESESSSNKKQDKTEIK